MKSDYCSWLNDPNIKPFILARPENLFKKPGEKNRFSIFEKLSPIIKNPLKVEEVDFVNQVLRLDGLAFGGSVLTTPRWVFYDCALIPGLVSGFAIRSSALDMEVKNRLGVVSEIEWVPLALFVFIPAVQKGHWMAHNLCSANSLLPDNKKLRGLGFMSKAFGLWYANVEVLYGVTQWDKPALKLHANYGEFELVTTYTPAHDYSHSVTYRMTVDPDYWPGFFDRDFALSKHKKFTRPKYELDPKSEKSLMEIQNLLENGEGPMYLNGQEILKNKLTDLINIY